MGDNRILGTILPKYSNHFPELGSWSSDVRLGQMKNRQKALGSNLRKLPIFSLIASVWRNQVLRKTATWTHRSRQSYRLQVKIWKVWLVLVKVFMDMLDCRHMSKSYCVWWKLSLDTSSVQTGIIKLFWDLAHKLRRNKIW